MHEPDEYLEGMKVPLQTQYCNLFYCELVLTLQYSAIVLSSHSDSVYKRGRNMDR
jgi:hypothetical protein